jgi:hypothetical protein
MVAIHIGLYQIERGVRIVQPYLHLKQAYYFVHPGIVASGVNLSHPVFPTVNLNPQRINSLEGEMISRGGN